MNKQIEKTILDYAKEYITKGFSVIPLFPQSKKPAIKWEEYQTRKPTDNELVRWFGAESQNNIGIVTGVISGIAVVDFDSPEAISFAKDNKFPPTPLVKTGKGYQAYYKYKDGVRNFQKRDDLPGIDLRAEGGYVVAPPSIHPSGKRYEWVEGLDDLPLAELPDIILAKKPEDKTPLKELYKGVSEGSRNISLARLVGSWANDGLTFEECLENAKLWNFKNNPPMDSKEIERTVKSVFERHHLKTPSQFYDTYNSCKTVKLTLTTTKDFYSYPDPEFLIDGLIIKDALTILSAYTGLGKSLLALNIAYAVATGRPFLDRFNTIHKGKILIIDEENPASFLKKRLQDYGFNGDMPVYFLHFQKIKLDNFNIFHPLVGIIKELKPTLVIIDALIRVHSQRENEATEMAIVMERLRDIVNLGCTVIVIHHHRKGVGDKKESVRGSSDILGGVDMHLSLEEKGCDLILSTPKTRLAPILPIRLRLEAVNGKPVFRYIGIEKTESQEILDEILDVLKTKDKLSIKEIFNELKHREIEVGENKLRDILKGANDKELLETRGDRGKKLYSINPTFTASRDIYREGNCETGNKPHNNLHSFTEGTPLNCETGNPIFVDTEVEL